MSPSSSATKMKSFGKISPFSGSFQRMSGFHPDDAAGGELDLRLVTQEELLVLDRLAQPALDLQALGQQEIQVAGEEAHGVAARVLRLVHRVVGMLQELVHVGRVVRIVADADRRRDVDLVAADLHRPRHLAQDLVRHHARALRNVEVGKDDHEFVAAFARHRVDFAHAGDEPSRDILEDEVAGVVAEGVVHQLEAVEVEEEHGDVALLAARGHDRLRQAVLHEPAVGQPGERVVVRHVVDRALGIEALGDVLHQRGETDDLADRIDERRVVPLAVDRAGRLRGVRERWSCCPRAFRGARRTCSAARRGPPRCRAARASGVRARRQPGIRRSPRPPGSMR
jgi:hypothetical protein